MAYVDLANRVYNGPGYMDLGAPSGVVWDARLDLLPLSTTANAATLRSALAAMGLTLTRASAATVQTSASEVVTSGIGVDDPRVGRYGLVIEESRQNRVLDATNLASANWSLGAGATRTAGQSDPAGGTAAYQSTAASGAFGLGETIGSGSDTRVIGSYWVKSSAGSAAAGFNLYRQLATTRAYDTTAVATTWERRTLDSGVMAAQSASLVLTDGRNFSGSGGLAAGDRDFVVYGAQREVGAFATELIPTAGAAATRAGERLAIDTSARLVRSGRIGIEIRFVPKFANTDITGSWAYLWSLDGNNQAYLQKSDNKIRVWSNGASFTTTLGPSWSAGDTVDMWIEAGGGSLVTRVVYRVNGGAATVLGTSGAPQASLVSGTGASFLSEVNTTSQSSSWVQRIRAYAPGRRPQWAA